MYVYCAPLASASVNDGMVCVCKGGRKSGNERLPMCVSVRVCERVCHAPGLIISVTALVRVSIILHNRSLLAPSSCQRRSCPLS